MSEIPRKVTVNIINEAIENSQEREHRSHLGGSLIGHECMRHIWYSFRWYYKETFNGRMLRLFDRGHGEEERFTNFLKQAGFNVMHSKPEPQKRYFAPNGHFSAEIDGQALGLPEAEEKLHNLEFKTYSEDSFLKAIDMKKDEYKKLKDKIPFVIDTKSKKAQHYYQMQVGMGLARLDGEEVERCLYLAVNKNDDCLAQERVKFSQKDFDNIMEKADTIIFGTVAPPRISDNPSWFVCRFCQFNEICHYGVAPEENCRTCKYSKPEFGGKWTCKKVDKEITTEVQRKKWDCHAFS